MKFEMAAIDAAQVREPQPGPAAEPGSGHGPVPVAARLEVTPWIATEFAVTIDVRPRRKEDRLLPMKLGAPASLPASGGAAGGNAPAEMPTLPGHGSEAARREDFVRRILTLILSSFEEERERGQSRFNDSTI